MTEELQVQIGGLSDGMKPALAAAILIGLGVLAYLIVSYLQTSKSEAKR